MKLSEELLDNIDGAEESRGRDSQLTRWAEMAQALEAAQLPAKGHVRRHAMISSLPLEVAIRDPNAIISSGGVTVGLMLYKADALAVIERVNAHDALVDMLRRACDMLSAVAGDLEDGGALTDLRDKYVNAVVTARNNGRAVLARVSA